MRTSLLDLVGNPETASKTPYFQYHIIHRLTDSLNLPAQSPIVALSLPQAWVSFPSTVGAPIRLWSTTSWRYQQDTRQWARTRALSRATAARMKSGSTSRSTSHRSKAPRHLTSTSPSARAAAPAVLSPLRTTSKHGQPLACRSAP